MSIGNLLLLLAAILVFSGLLQRVLDRMYLTDRQALILIGMMLLGTFVPDIPIGDVYLSIGGAVIPLGICGYLLIRADTDMERVRCLIGTIITAAAIYLISKLLPSEAEEMWMDPMWLYGPVGGIVAWLLGRSRRGAFVCGVAGTLLADIASGIVASLQGYEIEVHLGGGGIGDASVISSVIAVLLCETIGEIIERLSRPKREERA